MRRLVILLAIGSLLSRSGSAQSPDSVALVQLESVWNRAHVTGDTTTLARLWAPEFSATVPGMPRFSRSELMAFWRSGQSSITRYDTDSIQVTLPSADAAIVTGRLHRERSFGGRTAADEWLFTKVYVRRRGTWQAVAFHASPAP